MDYYRDEAKKVDEDTWRRYTQTRDIGLRNRILMAYLYIVTCSLKKSQGLTNSREDIEDMASHGILELINCIDRYDYTRGVQFDSFASIRVRGAIIDYIRKKDWVPRDVRKKVKMVNQTSQLMQDELGRPPGDAELAQRLQLSEEELAKIRFNEMNFHVVAFEETLLTSSMTLLDITKHSNEQTPGYKLMENDFKKQLAMYIDELDDKERTVISLYYFEELKLKEIAFVLGLTVSRVSQIHSKALSRLKQRITEYMSE